MGAKNVVLYYPPASSVWHLPMGIAYLAAILKNHGHDVLQRYGHILGVEHLLRQYDQAATDKALSIVRNSASTILDWHEARMTFERVSLLVPTQDTFAVERNNVRYDSKACKGRIDELVAVIAARESHPFYDYFVEVEVPLALEYQPHIYGISIADERQMVSGCILASLMKQVLPNTLVVMGGNFWARVQGAYADPAFGRLFAYWDAIVYGEGFQPMLELANGNKPSETSGTVWYDGSQVHKNALPAVPTSFKDLPVPIFDRQTRQWSPDFVAPLYTMSNCPMQCSFCSIAAGSQTFLGKPRSMSERTIAEHMVQIGTNRFDFQDEYLTIGRQLKLGQELRRIGYQATWQCYLTVNDQLLNPQLCHDLYEAGCRGVQLGLESLDPSTLNQEAKKWNHPDNYGQILRNLADAGIQNHVFLIVGCPNEQINWSLRWLAFLEEHGDSILTIKSGRYRLTRRAPDELLAQQGKLKGIELLDGPDDLLLNLNRDQFRYTQQTLSRKRVEAIRDVVEEACRRHWAYQVTSTLPWWNNRGRFTLAELRGMAELLATSVPTEPSLPEIHLRKALTRVGTALQDELGEGVKIKTYEEALIKSRALYR